MFILILESIGMSELILIGIVALIIFGPRKLPQMAKTVGKTMADFRRATNEFKETWEREASVLDELKIDDNELNTARPVENTISRRSLAAENKKDDFTPEIREIQVEELKELKENFPSKSETAEVGITEASVKDKTEVSKHDWL